MATINEIKQQAEAVKNATQVGENTAERVGGALAGLAEIAEQQNSKLSDLSKISLLPIVEKGEVIEIIQNHYIPSSAIDTVVENINF